MSGGGGSRARVPATLALRSQYTLPPLEEQAAVESTSDAVESTNLASICRFCGDASNAVVGCI